MTERLDRVWLSQAKAHPSTNHALRLQPIELVVVHCISLPPCQWGMDRIIELFLNRLDCDAHPYFDKLRGVRVSSHFLIGREGQLLQFVALDRIAWHAGRSVWHNRGNVNDFSIGIELEGSETTAFTDAQYQQLLSLLDILHQSFPRLRKSDIVGHSDVAPGRKTDPGPHFDWNQLKALSW